MKEHFIFLFYIFLFIFSTIGHGLLFSRIVSKNLENLNIGHQGIMGFFSLSIISIFSSYFFAHNYIFNTVLHCVGIIGFLFFFKKNNLNLQTKNFLILLFLMLLGVYVFKNHDDFPYYHLTYALNLSENKFIIGTGAFSHGFRTFSSLFYYHSLLYMPYIKFYLFHLGPFLILLFCNFLILKNTFDKFKKKEFNFVYFFGLISLIFINIVFYRIGEHGADRSSQILLLIISILFFELKYFEKDKNQKNKLFNIFLIIVFLAAIIKAIYYLYLIFVILILFEKNFIRSFFTNKNYLLMFVLTFTLILNIATNYLTTGCLLYPAAKTCIAEQKWSIPQKEVKQMNVHYEWWAKAGGGPGYKSDIKPEEYIKNFAWFKNWVDRHFFNKVSDTLFGVIAICIVCYLSFYTKKKNEKYKKKNILIFYILILFFLIEWFIKHPSMRYGGYVLIALPLITFTSLKIEKFKLSEKKILKVSVILILLALISFNLRNIVRLNKEINFYNYNIINSPYFYTENVNSIKIHENQNFKIYSVPPGKMCWASKTPCSYSRNLKSKKLLNLNIIYTDG